jgi:hypothetical protein
MIAYDNSYYYSVIQIDILSRLFSADPISRQLLLLSKQFLLYRNSALQKIILIKYSQIIKKTNQITRNLYLVEIKFI